MFFLSLFIFIILPISLLIFCTVVFNASDTGDVPALLSVAGIVISLLVLIVMSFWWPIASITSFYKVNDIQRVAETEIPAMVDKLNSWDMDSSDSMVENMQYVKIYFNLERKVNRYNNDLMDSRRWDSAGLLGAMYYDVPDSLEYILVENLGINGI